jgi:MSHA biogenesis protein MshL
LVLAGLAALALAGCASTGDGRSKEGKREAGARDTLTRIDGELAAAAATLKPASSKKVQDSMLPPLAVDLPKAAAEAVEPRFDLVVSKAPASQVFMALVANTPYSMLVPTEVSGTMSVSLKNVTVREALESIRDLYGYDFTIRGTRIQVQPNSLQTRVFQVNYLAGKRSGASDLRVTASSISMQSSGTTSGTGGTTTSNTTTTTRPSDSSRVSMSSESDFWAELKTALTALVGGEGGRNVILNPMSGIVLVKGLPSEIRSVENYLRATQLIIERQVMLEAKIVDVSLSDEFQSGVNWAAFGGRNNRGAIGVSGNNATLDTTGPLSIGAVTAVAPGAGGAIVNGTTGGGFNGLALQTNNFAALITFLETQGKVQVLSSPRIATLNNQKAVLKVGADEFYVTNVTTSTNSTGSTSTTSPTITLQPFFSGISLDVTPQIDEANNIILHVHPAVSVVSEKQKQIDLGTLGNFVLPLATSTINETDSIVRVQDGNIVAIGGLMKQEQSDGRSQVPGLGDVPLVGGLFGQRASSLRKRELVILIKPTLIQGDAQWAQDVADTQARIREYGPTPKREEQSEGGRTAAP